MTTIKHEPTWHIAGVGAMGGLLASAFSLSGHSTQLILKNKHQLETYHQSKLTIIQGNNEESCHPPATDIDHLKANPIDHIICCVKAYDITPLLLRLQSHLNDNSIIILLHNGLGVIDEIKEQLPNLRIISGISTIGTYLETPFRVRAFLNGNISLGPVIGEFSTDEISMISSAFTAANLPYQWESHIENMMWEKFALNCSVNLLTALLNCKNGDLLNHIELLRVLTDEIGQVMLAYGIDMASEQLFVKVTQLLERVGNNYSSMYKDVHHNKPTELRYLNEYLVELAKRKKISTPMNCEIINQFYKEFLYTRDLSNC